MDTIKVHEIAESFPDFPELRPVLQRILFESLPDPDGGWTASGELGTLSERVVPGDALDGTARELADEVRDRLVPLYECMARTLRARARGDGLEAARALLDAASLEEDGRRADRAEAYVRAARHLVADPCEAGVRARCVRRLARILRSRGRLAESGELYEEAYELGRTCDHERETAVAAIGRGNVAVDHGRWAEAEEWYRRAAELLEAMEVGPEHWHVQANLAIAARHQGDLERCEAHLEKAGAMAGLVGAEEAAPLFDHGWGMLRMAAGEMEAAAERFRAGLLAVDDPTARVRMSVNLGECLLAMDEVAEAEEMARRAEWIALDEDVVRKLPEVYRLLGKVATREERESAVLFFERSLKIIHARGLPGIERARTLEAYAEFERSAGRRPSAESKLEKAARLYEEIGDRRAVESVRARIRSGSGEERVDSEG